jgi:hypothetical protein
VVTIEQAVAMIDALPGVTMGERYGNRTWFVGKKAFVWERPFSKADLKRFGDEPVPDGPILAVSVEDLADKEAVLAARHRGFFTIEHFDGFAAVLVQLRVAAPGVVDDAILDAWLTVVPEAVGREHLDAIGSSGKRSRRS